MMSSYTLRVERKWRVLALHLPQHSHLLNTGVTQDVRKKKRKRERRSCLKNVVCTTFSSNPRVNLVSLHTKSNRSLVKKRNRCIWHLQTCRVLQVREVTGSFLTQSAFSVRSLNAWKSVTCTVLFLVPMVCCLTHRTRPAQFDPVIVAASAYLSNRGRSDDDEARSTALIVMRDSQTGLYGGSKASSK